MVNFIHLVPAPVPGQYSSAQSNGNTSLHGPQNTQVTVDKVVLDNALPIRSTCPMPYYPEAGVDRDEHSGASACKFYICCPARVQGCFTDEQRSLRNVHGWRNGKIQSVQTFDEATDEWAPACRRWHGTICRDARTPATGQSARIMLNASLPQEQWALKGVSQLFNSRQTAFAAAEALNLKKVQILASRDEGRLEAWQYDEE